MIISRTPNIQKQPQRAFSDIFGKFRSSTSTHISYMLLARKQTPLPWDEPCPESLTRILKLKKVAHIFQCDAINDYFEWKRKRREQKGIWMMISDDDMIERPAKSYEKSFFRVFFYLNLHTFTFDFYRTSWRREEIEVSHKSVVSRRSKTSNSSSLGVLRKLFE